MKQETSRRVVHSFDPERHQVRCGVSEQTSSTKHAGAVTCAACRALLGRPAEADAAARDE